MAALRARSRRSVKTSSARGDGDRFDDDDENNRLVRPPPLMLLAVVPAAVPPNRAPDPEKLGAAVAAGLVARFPNT